MRKASSFSLPFSHEHDDLVFASHISDLVQISCDRYIKQKTKFLSDRQRKIAEYVLVASDNPVHGFYGGYPDSERTVLVLSGNPSDELSQEDYCINPILISGSGFKALSHRDYLGSVLSLGLERELIGDIICIDKQSAVLFACSVVSDYITSNLTNVSNDGVKCRILDTSSAQFNSILSGLSKQYERRSETVPSMRLDAVCAAAIGVSRTKAEALIESGNVEVNHFTTIRKDSEVVHGDRISVRGFGKYRIEHSGGLSKKGRMWIEILRYI